MPAQDPRAKGFRDNMHMNVVRFPALRTGRLYHQEILLVFDVMCLSVHRCICIQKKNQPDATEWFIALIICSTCFGHFYVHHQEVETICVLLPPMVSCAWLLVVGGQVQDSRLCVQKEGCCTTAVGQHPSFWTHI